MCFTYIRRDDKLIRPRTHRTEQTSGTRFFLLVGRRNDRRRRPTDASRRRNHDGANVKRSCSREFYNAEYNMLDVQFGDAESVIHNEFVVRRSAPVEPRRL